MRLRGIGKSVISIHRMSQISEWYDCVRGKAVLNIHIRASNCHEQHKKSFKIMKDDLDGIPMRIHDRH